MRSSGSWLYQYEADQHQLFLPTSNSQLSIVGSPCSPAAASVAAATAACLVCAWSEPVVILKVVWLLLLHGLVHEHQAVEGHELSYC